ncbi:ADP-ribosyl cyclase/cyclic ADP-ribose hydrolase 1-like isoform X3 [Labrus bergylta]|uniref:ADP-ribosyl cyclase/cyclic ADP-ribose hydrolase 1-like isoform X3 n=1 Tax=Labrus bergylta TaxID=56723 RepID=UPI00331423A9
MCWMERSGVSAMFAQHASGTVTVMLNGQNEEPFSPNSVLGSVEIPNLQAGRVTKVNVYVITDENKSQLKKCIAENPPCGACWAGLRDSKSNDTIRQDTT